MLGPVLASDRGNLTGFRSRSATGVVPAGTVWARVEVTLTQVSPGAYNDGYADDVVLKLLPGVHLYLPLLRR